MGEEPVEEIKSIKDLKPVKKKPAKVEAEEKPASNFPAIKLKKTETVKRPVEKVKMEKVELVHHTFENTPQHPVKEQDSDVKITSVGRIKDEDDSKIKGKKEQKVKKVKKIIKKPVTTDEEPSTKESSPVPSETPAEDDSLITEPAELIASKGETPDTIPKQTSDLESKHEVEQIESEAEDKIPSKKPLKKEELKTEEIMAATDMKPDALTLEEPVEQIKTIKDLKPVKKKPVKVTVEEKPAEIFPEIKLKKTETVKRPVEKVKMEKVELVHHSFENTPQHPVKEQESDVKITSVGRIQVEDDSKIKGKKDQKVKKVKKIIKKKKPTEDDQQSMKESSPAPSEIPSEIDISLKEPSESSKLSDSENPSESIQPEVKSVA